MSVRPWVLGLSTGLHNGAACLCRGDEIVVAMQEERLTRVKRAPIERDRRSHAVDYCLAAAGITVRDLDLVVDCNISVEPAPATPPLIIGGKPCAVEYVQIPHHLGHAISVFCTSGFDESDVLVIDGGGSYGWQLPAAERARAHAYADDWCEHISLYHADRRGFTLIEKHMADVSYVSKVPAGMVPFRSLGHMFSSAAFQIFGDYFEAGKVMALAPFGHPTIPAGDFVAYDGRSFAFSDRVPQLFPHDERWPDRGGEYCNLAASVQRALEVALAAYLQRVRHGSGSTGQPPHLCYAGGVALNMVANRRVVRPAGFRDVFILPAAEDSGTAIGAAYYGAMTLERRVPARRLTSDSLGRRYSTAEVDRAIARMPGIEVVPSDHLLDDCVNLLCEGHVVGWFQGGAEFGPRALGHRSILCDPRHPDAKALLNNRVKHRESFRPFAPAVLAEHAAEWFAIEGPTRLTDFMLEAGYFRAPLPGPQVPAVTDVDGTGRLQTVTWSSNERLYALLRAFHRRTGVPMIVNTSMNVMGEPIVETPRDALWLLLFTGIDYCVIEDRIVCKAPAFTSVLDLVPSRTVTGERAPSGTRLSEVLQRIDNVLSFRALFASMDPGLEDGEQRRIVAALFRQGLIDVSMSMDVACGA